MFIYANSWANLDVKNALLSRIVLITARHSHLAALWLASASYSNIADEMVAISRFCWWYEII